MRSRLPRCWIAVLVVLAIHAGPSRAAPRYSLQEASAMVCARLAELKAALKPERRGRITIAVGMTQEGRILIATSDNDRPKLRDELRSLLRPGDEVLTNQYKGKLHAEEKIVRRAGTSLYVLAASWSICSLCAGQIGAVHAVAVTACRGDAKQRPSREGLDPAEPAPEEDEPPQPPAGEEP